MKMQLLFTQQTGEKTNFERLFYENFAFHRFLLQSESQESKQPLYSNSLGSITFTGLEIIVVILRK